MKPQTHHRLRKRSGADVVLEVAGAKDPFRLAWRAIVTVVALYDEAQSLPLPDMYGKNLTFKTGSVDGCDCAEILALIEAGKIDTTPLITHRFKLDDIEEAYFGIHTLLLEGGSILNGAFQRSGVIDELSLVVAPIVAGTEDKPLFMDTHMETYRLAEVKNQDGILWLNYKR